MSKLNKIGLKNELFLFILYNQISDNSINLQELKILLNTFGYNSNIIKKFIYEGFLVEEGNAIFIQDDIIKNIEEVYNEYGSASYPIELGNSQKKFLQLISRQNVSLKDEIDKSPMSIDILLSLLKSKYISINNPDYFITKIKDYDH